MVSLGHDPREATLWDSRVTNGLGNLFQKYYNMGAPGVLRGNNTIPLTPRSLKVMQGLHHGNHMEEEMKYDMETGLTYGLLI